MITNQSRVRSFPLFRISDPFSAFLHDFILLEIEMSANDGLEALGWFLQVLQHGELDIPISDDVGVGLVFLLPLNGSLLMLEPWLIEVNLL